jgi:transposase
MKRTRKKHNAVIKAKGGGGGGRGDRTIAELASEFGVHPNGIYNCKKQLLDGAASVFEGAGGARMLGKRRLEKRCPSDGDRGFESNCRLTHPIKKHKGFSYSWQGDIRVLSLVLSPKGHEKFPREVRDAGGVGEAEIRFANTAE